mmetsp:Transcript_10434/g.26499  ORF Transcript_10434/g.26499 Transcript_10434/m.26499 type:complete len:109 (-) Transcript_10434:36-362(-)
MPPRHHDICSAPLLVPRRALSSARGARDLPAGPRFAVLGRAPSVMEAGAASRRRRHHLSAPPHGASPPSFPWIDAATVIAPPDRDLAPLTSRARSGSCCCDEKRPPSL